MKIFSRLLADDVDLVDVGNAQEPLADVFGARLELGEAQAVGSQHVDRRIDVAVLVVEIRSDDAGRQVALDVADLLADLIPELLHLGGRRPVDQVDLDEGHARLRIAFDAVEIGKFLQLLLDLVGDLGLHLGRGRAGPGDVHHHGLDGEGRVFGTPEVEVGIGPRRAEHEDHEQDERRCVIAHSERLKRIMARTPVGPLADWSMLIDGADLLTGVELLDAERDDALAVVHARGHERRVGGEGRDRHRAQLERAGLVDHIDRRTRAAIEDRRERELGNRGVVGVRQRHGRGHAERDCVVGIFDGEARGIGAGLRVGLRRQFAQPRR